MQPAAVQVPANMTIAARRSGSWLAYARALTMTAWLFSLVVGYWWRQEWDDIYEMLRAGVDLKQYYYYGIAIAFVGHLTLGPVKWVGAVLSFLSTTVGKIFAAFFLFMLVLTPFSLTPLTSARYLIATFGVLILCSLFWASDYRVLRRVLVFTGMLLFAWIYLLMAHHGLTRSIAGTIGGINRNMIGKMALVAMTCLLFADKKALRVGGICLAVGLCVLITSRGTLLAMTVLLTVYYSLSKGTAKALAHAGLAMFLVIMVLLASTAVRGAVLDDVLRLSDKNRGLGSGFTGRLGTWIDGLEAFRKRPFQGYGFRATVGGARGIPGAHSGYVNLLMETGVIGTSLIIGAVLTSIYQRVRLVQKLRPWVDVSSAAQTLLNPTMRFNAIAVASLCAVGILWVYEPMYVNLGQIASIFFFLIVASPLYPDLSERELAAAFAPITRTAVRR
jgi:O-antigen ligase